MEGDHIMESMIKNIELWKNNPLDYNGIEIVRINFKSSRSWAVLRVDELLEILRLWIIGEEKKYPQEKGFKGRWMLFDEIKKVFDEK